MYVLAVLNNYIFNKKYVLLYRNGSQSEAV